MSEPQWYWQGLSSSAMQTHTEGQMLMAKRAQPLRNTVKYTLRHMAMWHQKHSVSSLIVERKHDSKSGLLLQVLFKNMTNKVNVFIKMLHHLLFSQRRQCRKFQGQKQKVASLVARVLPPHWHGIPGCQITCRPNREDHTSRTWDDYLSWFWLGNACSCCCSHAKKKKVWKKNNRAPGSDCSTGAGVIHHAETHTEWL